MVISYSLTTFTNCSLFPAIAIVAFNTDEVVTEGGSSVTRFADGPLSANELIRLSRC